MAATSGGVDRSPRVKLLVTQAVSNRSVHRRTASTMAGRTSPLSRDSTTRPSTRWPRAAASASKAVANPSMPNSPRSRWAQALSSGSVELTSRMNPTGSPSSRSYRAKASNGLEVITPPKSNITERITVPPRGSEPSGQVVPAEDLRHRGVLEHRVDGIGDQLGHRQHLQLVEATVLGDGQGVGHHH